MASHSLVLPSSFFFLPTHTLHPHDVVSSPPLDILAKLFVDDAGKGGGAAASTNKVRAKYTVQARKGRKMGEPIPLDIEITDLDRSQHLSLPQQQTLEHHRHALPTPLRSTASLVLTFI